MSGFSLSASGATASNTRDPTPPPGRVRTQPPADVTHTGSVGFVRAAPRPLVAIFPPSFLTPASGR